MAKLTLLHPVQVTKNHTLTELHFRDYTTAGDYLVFDQQGLQAQTIGLVSSLTNTDEAIIRLLRGVDYQRASKLANAMIDADYAAVNLPQPEADPETKADASAEKSPEDTCGS